MRIRPAAVAVPAVTGSLLLHNLLIGCLNLFKPLLSLIPVGIVDIGVRMRRFGFFLGKFIYLMDAYEDVETDIRNGTPNPLKGRYGSPDFERPASVSSRE